MCRSAGAVATQCLAGGGQDGRKLSRTDLQLPARRFTRLCGRERRGARSRLNIGLRCAADRMVNLSISAGTHFVPVADGTSAGGRTLASMVRQISLGHGVKAGSPFEIGSAAFVCEP